MSKKNYSYSKRTESKWSLEFDTEENILWEINDIIKYLEIRFSRLLA